MAKISSEQKLDNFRNMRAMMEDYQENSNRYPTTKEFMEKLGMSEATAKRYKSIIISEIKIKMKDSFHENILISAGKIVKKIDNSIKIFEDIMENGDRSSDKINAAREIILAEQYKLKVMRDGAVFLEEDNNDEVRNDKQCIYGESESEEQITEGLSNTF